jgi:DnaJ-class molecular chaperone
MAKSYFAVLGVSSEASSEEIRSAYRRLAKEFHPDHFDGGSARFRQIQEAYSVLGNARKRKEYENSRAKPEVKRPAGPARYPEPEPLIPGQGPMDMGDIAPLRSFRTFTPSFDEIFDRLRDKFFSPNPSPAGRVQNLTLEVPLTRQQALRGGNARIMVPARAVCPTCGGYGRVGPYECNRCAGGGVIAGEMPVAVAFPPGLARDHAVVISLERFGIRNLHLTVLFRPSHADPF